MQKFVLKDFQSPGWPTFASLPRSVEEVIEFWQKRGGVPTHCQVCSSELKKEEKKNVDGFILRCRNSSCRETACVRPEWLQGLGGDLVQHQQHFYLCCLKMQGVQRQKILGITKDQAGLFLKRFRNLYLK